MWRMVARIKVRRLSHSEARPTPLLNNSDNFPLSRHLLELIKGRLKDEGLICECEDKGEGKLGDISKVRFFK